ncbi:MULTISPECIES: formate dehydrogenase subunit gamma [unclassified Paracoccus (in: a-proteobacteria)]|uniref:formate dehydrogenase subunit gamma n=1 Tax=unclassified Paracoccus (in: a-proteobacteria) TaxID=2688777 RepID=UPI0015FECE5F|nr:MULTISPECIES: formate dehydrogenase subunit gamma [unclassified Paracoccus (in: a-proteobacteria)]MBB1492021.1 formate dehydrogenase subunit gamma [Paracoccus sp. MC1854]MBB1497907.1 formate dehydrogenase subunit gamma [Paracoccus sp. MC1862]QQO44301.1 formate dehydrogenase subunit gamma [Paracoccus sp. MC1862]
MVEPKFSEPTDAIVQMEPVEVRRYVTFTRINHWFTALCFIVLMLSGFAFFHPSLFGLTALFGGGQNTRWLHPFVGIALSISFLGMFVQLVHLNIIRREDLVWTRNIKDVITGHDERLPELGKYNFGQKSVFWGMFWLILVLLITGIMMWYQYFPDIVSVETRRLAIFVHSVSAVLIVLVFILHIFAALWTRGTLRAMTRGTVTGGWSWRHHRKWLRELARRQGAKPAE